MWYWWDIGSEEEADIKGDSILSVIIKFGHRDYRFNFKCMEFEILVRQLSVGCQIKDWMEIEHREK